MFRMTYTEPAEIAGEITLKRKLTGLGIYEDVDGVRWDIRGIYPDFVQAARVDEMHPHYTDTSGASYGFSSQKWKPYRTTNHGE